jgi:hypothetical protein
MGSAARPIIHVLFSGLANSDIVPVSEAMFAVELKIVPRGKKTKEVLYRDVIKGVL